MSEPASPATLGEALDGRRVVLCLGPGGVGKTTTAAALGLALERRGERVVVLTIDPARRLAQALGIPLDDGSEPTLVPTGSKGGGELWAAMLDPAATFASVIRAEAADPAQAERILVNPLFSSLTRSLSGTAEYMAAEQVYELSQDERFDRIIVDTPPSRHAFDFLDAPGRLTRFVDHRLYRTFFAPPTYGLPGVSRARSLGTRAASNVLTRLVGKRLVVDVVDFFGDFATLDAGFRRRAAALDALLSSAETGQVLITAPRRDPLTEAVWISDRLVDRGRSVDAFIVNRSLPVFAPPKAKASRTVTENHRQLAAMAAAERALVEEFADNTVPTIWLPEHPTPPQALASLTPLSEILAL